MSYIGNPPAEAYTNTVKDTFSGDGSTTAFTMSQISLTNDVRVVVENVVQDPTVAYSCAGTTLTFTSAPPTGTNNIYVVHLGPAVMTALPPAEIAQATTFNSNVSVGGNLTVDTNTLYVDSTNNNVGIRTSSPSFESGTGTGLEINNSSGNGAHVKLTDAASGSGGTNGFDLYAFNTSGYIENYEAGSIVFRNGGSERARVDASGNLLVGTTNVNIRDSSTNDGLVYRTGNSLDVTNNGNTVAIFNRNTDDGDIVTFRKGAVDVGSIGTGSGVMAIAGPSGNGLSFPNNLVLPSTSSAGAKDASTDLGVSYSRFKDLYLSGGVFLGGTGSSNKLEDYEEGSWTPYFSSANATFSYGAQSGNYLKIGGIVHAQFYLRATASGTTSNVCSITNLPFASQSIDALNQWGSSIWFSGSVDIQPLVNNNSSAVSLWKQGAVAIATAAEIASDYYLVGHVSYRAN